MKYSRTQTESGFSLIESLVASVLIVLALWGTSMTLMVSNRTSRGSRLQSQLERLIEQDIAIISDLSERYTCCPGSCTTDATVINTANASGDCAMNSTGAGVDQYYAPVQPYIPIGGTFTTAMANFRAACANGTLANNLITAFPVAPTAPAGATLTRSTPTLEDAAAHRLAWTYTASIDGSPVISRVVHLIPTVAGWCP